MLVSKPPAPEVAAEIDALLPNLGTPVVKALLGTGQGDLTQAVAPAVEALGGAWQAPRAWGATAARPPRERRAGRLLRRDALRRGDADRLGRGRADRLEHPARGRAGVVGRPGRADGGAGHVMIDFGEDELTRGRPHPMIDGTIRIDWILQQAADPATAHRSCSTSSSGTGRTPTRPPTWPPR